MVQTGKRLRKDMDRNIDWKSVQESPVQTHRVVVLIVLVLYVLEVVN